MDIVIRDLDGDELIIRRHHSAGLGPGEPVLILHPDEGNEVWLTVEGAQKLREVINEFIKENS